MSSPELWLGDLVSDFDGTAVKKYPKYRWQNWTKTHLPLLPHYPEFVMGAQSGGLRPANFLTIRKPGGQREKATRRSIAELGLQGLFEDDVDFASNKAKKAKRLAQRVSRSNSRPVAMLEDYPDDLVPRVVDELRLRAHPSKQSTLVVGAVDHPHRQARLKDMQDQLRGRDTDILELGEEGDASIIGSNFTIDVVRLEPYSFEAGEAFAAHAIAVFQQAASTD